MPPQIIDGKAVAANFEAKITSAIDVLKARGERVPGLAVVLVGSDQASKTYVGNKDRMAKKCGFYTEQTNLPATIRQEELLAVIDRLNADPKVDGILVQLPLPAGLEANEVIDRIDPAKDADGLHSFNQGLLLKGVDAARPCTPLGVMNLIDSVLGENCRLDGKHAVVVGRSVLVGKPVAMMLLERNATVTIAHSKTPSLPELCATADVLVAAVGREKMIKAAWVREGAIVIDVGINRNELGKLCGDVDYLEVAPKTTAITPVPGGVGPMTVAMLLLNTLGNRLRAKH